MGRPVLISASAASAPRIAVAPPVMANAAARPASRETAVEPISSLAAGFFLGTGVPNNHQQADQTDHHRNKAGPPGDHLAEARAEQPAVEYREGKVADAGSLRTLAAPREWGTRW